MRRVKQLEQQIDSHAKVISALAACLDTDISGELKESLREQILIKDKARADSTKELAGRSSRELKDKLDVVNCQLVGMRATGK